MITDLPPPELEAGQGRFVGHAARQAQDVADGIVFAGVVPHAAAAERRAEIGVVHRDDGFQAAGVVAAENHLFVIGKITQGKNGHGKFLRCW
jgi:hypothetical protein